MPLHLPLSQPRCTRFNISFLHIKPKIIEGPEGLFWLLKEPACAQGDGRNRLGKETGILENIQSVPRQQLLKYQNLKSARFWSRG